MDLERADVVYCEKPYVLVIIYPLVLAFLLIRTAELYSYDTLLEQNIHFKMGNGIFC